jgi:hypothetical protein
MWTAQTYLGAHVADAKYFIYLLAEDYIEDQLKFQRDVINNLRKLGMKTGKESAIFVPDDCAKAHIDMELFNVFTHEMMYKIAAKTPGLLFTDKNLGVLDPVDDRWVFLSLRPYLEKKGSERLPEFFSRIEETIMNSDDLLKGICGSKWESIWQIIKDTVMLEPNLSGLGVDLRAAQLKMLVKNQIR